MTGFSQNRTDFIGDVNPSYRLRLCRHGGPKCLAQLQAFWNFISLPRRFVFVGLRFTMLLNKSGRLVALQSSQKCRNEQFNGDFQR